MFMLRASGATLLLFAAFNLAFGLNGAAIGWLISALLLMVAGIALVQPRRLSRVIVYAAALSAAVIGAVSQILNAQATQTDLAAAGGAWALWSAIWLTTAYIGTKYLPEGPGVRETA